MPRPEKSDSVCALMPSSSPSAIEYCPAGMLCTVAQSRGLRTLSPAVAVDPKAHQSVLLRWSTNAGQVTLPHRRSERTSLPYSPQLAAFPADPTQLVHRDPHGHLGCLEIDAGGSTAPRARRVRSKRICFAMRLTLQPSLSRELALIAVFSDHRQARASLGNDALLIALA